MDDSDAPATGHGAAAINGPAATGDSPQIDGSALTALMTAAARAIAADRGGALAPDPYARLFVQAGRLAGLLPATSGEEQELLWEGIATYLDIRSHYFDSYLAAVATPQIVQLAAGLDMRAFRLDWPEGTAIYELDQPVLLEFKRSVLASATGPLPKRPGRRVVVADLLGAWPAALLASGFDPGVPATWIAEGALFYLPAQAEPRIVADICRLSAPGSRLVLEHIPEVGRWMADQRFAEGERVSGVGMTAMLESGTRPSPAALLAERGWTTHEETVGDVARRYGRYSADGPVGSLSMYARYITAQRPVR